MTFDFFLVFDHLELQSTDEFSGVSAAIKVCCELVHGLCPLFFQKFEMLLGGLIIWILK